MNKRCNDIDKDKYLNVLLSKESSEGVNKGFRVVGNNMYTYNQVRQGFSYFYPKRKGYAHGTGDHLRRIVCIVCLDRFSLKKTIGSFKR